MSRHFVIPIALLALGVLGCERPDSDDLRSVQQVPTGSDLAPAAPAADEDVLAEEDGHRVLVRSVESERRLVWEVRSGANWKTKWESRDIYHARPEVTLLDANGDGATDLFWAFTFEEMVGGILIVDSSGVPLELHPGVDECLQPEIHRSGNRTRFIVHAPSIHTAEECADPVVRDCVEDLQMDLPRVFVVEGFRLREEEQSTGELRHRFEKVARTLDSLQAAGATLPGTTLPYEACGRETAGLLRSFADSIDSSAEANREWSPDTARSG
ncbi:MAG TPA: hypothetical protein VF192_05015 [Longimicrobiales bacterium]